MAQSEPVKSSEIIESNLFGDTTKSAEQLLLTLSDLSAGFKKINKDSIEYLKANRDPKNSTELKKTAKALDDANKSRKAAIEVDRQAAKVKKALTDQEIKDAAIAKAIEKQRQDALRATAILESKQLGLEAKLLAQNTLLRIERAKLTGEEANYAEQLARINSSLDANNAKIKENSDKQKQQSINVGNYSESIQDALNKTGLFGEVIGKVTAFVELYGQEKKKATVATRTAAVATEVEAAAHIENLAAVQAETVATEKLSFAKKALNAITSPVGLLVLAGAALLAIIKAVYDVNQSLQDALALGKAFAEDKFWGTGTQFRELELATVSLRKEIGGLTLQLQKLTQDEADFIEISNDSTLSLNEQNAALQESIRIGILKSQQQVDIAKREKEIADARVKAEESRNGVGTGNALQEFYDKQVEATKKLAEAQDELDDRDRVNAQNRRSRFQQEIIDQIELLRSKKLGADAEIAQLTKQFNDEKNQLEERDKFNKQLREAELKAQAEEFALFQKGTSAKIDLLDLVATKDGVELANKLKKLRLESLSAAQADELAKIIKQAQDNEILNNERIEKQQDEYIARQKTIRKIQEDIAKMQRESDLDDLEERQKDAQLRQSELFNDIMVAERVFNNEKAKVLNQAGELELKLQGKVTQTKLENLELDAQQAKQAAFESINDEKIRNAEILKIQEKFILDKQKIQADAEGVSISISKRNAEALAAIELKQTTITLQELGKVGAAYEEELDKRGDMQAKQADKQIQKTQDTISRQRELAEKGLANELAFQEEKLAKQELAKQDAEERRARQKEILDMVQQYNAFLITRLNQPNADPNTAAALALSDTLLAKGIAKGLVQFAHDGNEWVQPLAGQKAVRGKDTIPFMLEAEEAVIPAVENRKHRGATKALINGTFEKMYMPRAQFEQSAKEIRKSTADQIYASLAIQQQVQTNNYLKEIADKPIPQFDVDKLGNLVSTISKRGRKTVIIHKFGK